MKWTGRSALKSAVLGAAFGASHPLQSKADAQAGDAGQQSLPPALARKMTTGNGTAWRLAFARTRSARFPLTKCSLTRSASGVHSISFKEVHIPLSSTPEERRQFRDKAQQTGLTIRSCGVIYRKKR